MRASGELVQEFFEYSKDKVGAWLVVEASDRTAILLCVNSANLVAVLDELKADGGRPVGLIGTIETLGITKPFVTFRIFAELATNESAKRYLAVAAELVQARMRGGSCHD